MASRVHHPRRAHFAKRRKLTSTLFIPPRMVREEPGSDTEPDEDSEEVAQYYLTNMRGKGSTQLGLHFHELKREKQSGGESKRGKHLMPMLEPKAESSISVSTKQEHDKSLYDVNSETEGEAHGMLCSGLPTLSSASFSDSWTLQHPTEKSAIRQEPKQDPVPTHVPPSVPHHIPSASRRSCATTHHRGAASANPLDAYDKYTTMHVVERQNYLASRSFGDTRAGDVSMSNERENSPLLGLDSEKRKTEGVEDKKIDLWKGKPWIQD